MREIKYHVMTMKWDNIYSCYYGVSLFETSDYHECEKFCFNYDGEEDSIFIEKVFVKAQRKVE